jgi:DNA-binding phage protein
VSPRQSHLRRPLDYVVHGEWPTAQLSGPGVVMYAQLFAQKLQLAIGTRGVRDVARGAALSHSTLLAVLHGERWPDMVTVAKLEESLNVNLWPGPEVRKLKGGHDSDG